MDHEPILRECDHCGRTKPCRSLPDPFVAEVYNERTEPSWWCDDCYGDRRDDI